MGGMGCGWDGQGFRRRCRTGFPCKQSCREEFREPRYLAPCLGMIDLAELQERRNLKE